MLFNTDTSRNAEKDKVINEFFVKTMERYFNEVLTHRGYVYLNEIYEALGFSWSPSKKNTCYIYEKDNHIDFGIIITSNGIELKNI